MGVKSSITLEELNTLFDTYNFIRLTPTTDGVMDTTYIAATEDKSYILKHYERDISQKIQRDTDLLKILSTTLNVPSLIASSNVWYLYKKLPGKTPKNINYNHISALARFLSALHIQSKNFKGSPAFIENYPLTDILNATKKQLFSHYKKLADLQTYNPRCDGFIHGDIFKDNTVFDGNKIGVFDFIDGGCGSFVFDIAVALLAFNPTNKQSYNRLFLQTYNQYSRNKISLEYLEKNRKTAAKLYALLRIDKYQNTKKANELIRYI